MMKYIITRYTNLVKNPFNSIKNNIFDFNNLFRIIAPKKNDSLVIYGEANSVRKNIPFNEQWECKDFYKKNEK